MKINRLILSRIMIILLMLMSLICLAGCSKDNEIKKDKKTMKEISVESDKYIEAYIYDDTSEKDIQDTKNNIESIKGVYSVEYISKEKAYSNAIEKLGGNSVVLSGYTQEVHPFPASFVIKIVSNVKPEELVDEIEKYDIFKHVQINSKAAEEVN